MHKSAKLKVKGGKLLEVEVEHNGVIKSIKITGDFFMHPESALQDIEKLLVGTSIDETEHVIAAKISKKTESAGVTMIGVSPEAIAEAVKMAIDV